MFRFPLVSKEKSLSQSVIHFLAYAWSIASKLNDLVLSFAIRFTDRNILSDGRPRNLLTQTFPTVALFPFRLFAIMQISMIGKWPQRHVSGSSDSYTSTNDHSDFAAAQFAAIDSRMISAVSLYSDIGFTLSNLNALLSRERALHQLVFLNEAMLRDRSRRIPSRRISWRDGDFHRWTLAPRLN